MGVDYYVCDYCNEAMSEYDYIHCSNDGEHMLCSCSIPDEIEPFLRYWDNIYELKKTHIELFDKYFEENNDYGIVLKKEFCPCCQKREKYKDDPQYQEYLRLKKIYES